MKKPLFLILIWETTAFRFLSISIDCLDAYKHHDANLAMLFFLPQRHATPLPAVPPEFPIPSLLSGSF